MVSQARPTTGNRLLDRLPVAEFERLRPHLDRIAFRPRDEVSAPGARAAYVLFPVGGLFSLRLPLRGGEAEIASVGREGLIGLAACFGLAADPLRVVARVGGECLRAPADLLRGRRPAGDVITGYAAYNWWKCHQTAACHLTHEIGARLSRLLLTVRDRVGADEFDLTHGWLADMVGASRQTVTEVAGEAQAAGLIAYHRGRVRVLDPAGLEARACECYRAMRDFYERVVG